MQSVEANSLLPGSLADEPGVSPAERVARSEQNPRRREALKRARARIAERLPAETFPLAKLRLSRSLSQSQLAARMGVAQPYIARIERGEDDLKFSTIERLAAALGVSADTVFRAITINRHGRV